MDRLWRQPFWGGSLPTTFGRMAPLQANWAPPHGSHRASGGAYRALITAAVDIAKRRFEQALARLPHAAEVEVVYRAFELDPGAPRERTGDHDEHLARKYGLTVERARQMNAQMTETAAAEGLDIRFDLLRGGNTFDAHRLLPGRVADKAQKSWVMQGFAAARATSPDGRWVYTLYANPGGYPFVHALDTVRGVAHCVGLPWTSVNQNAIFNAKLALSGGRLAVQFVDGSTWRTIDVRTWRVSQP